MIRPGPRPRSAPHGTGAIHRRRLVAGLRTVLAFVLLGAAGAAYAQTPLNCTSYASPTGQGNGGSPDKAFRVATFWKSAEAGNTLCLLDGTYTDTDSMIAPPSGLRGASGRPITIRALHEGKVRIDGQGKRLPIRLWWNDWMVVEGLNACCSSGAVVGLDHSNHNVIRRVAAWDAAEGNNDVFGVHFGEHNLLEDVAGWGIARKVYESSQGGDYTTIRRAWGRWEGSHVIGPKMVYTVAYNNYGMLLENAIGTWSGERMKDSYVLLDYYGKPWSGRGEGTYHNRDVDQPYAVFGMDALKKDKKAKARLLGSLAYIGRRDSFKAPQLVFVTNMDAVEIADTIAYVESDAYPQVKTFALYGLTAATNLLAHSITSIGGAGARIKHEWETRNVLEGPSLAVYKPGENAFSTTRGANLCNRYVDGVRTTEPLWPWPMNQRILEATVASGRAPVDVTTQVQAILGPIPPPCLASP